MTSSKQEKRPTEECRVLSAGLEFHNHSGASFLLSIRRFSRKFSLKIQSSFCTCQPVGAGSNVKTDSSKLWKDRKQQGMKKRGGQFICYHCLLSFPFSAVIAIMFLPMENSPLQQPFQHHCSAAHLLLTVRWRKPPNEMDTRTKSSASSTIL